MGLLDVNVGDLFFCPSVATLILIVRVFDAESYRRDGLRTSHVGYLWWSTLARPAQHVMTLEMSQCVSNVANGHWERLSCG